MEGCAEDLRWVVATFSLIIQSSSGRPGCISVSADRVGARLCPGEAIFKANSVVADVHIVMHGLSDQALVWYGCGVVERMI